MLCRGKEIDDLVCDYIPRDTPNSQCGNPWNSISSEYAVYIRRQQPEPVKMPVHGERPVINMKFFTFDEMVEYVSDSVFSDCWSVYKRNGDSHVVETLYYQLPLDANREIYDNEQEKRGALAQNAICDILKNLDNSELCLSFGMKPFMDYYIRKSPETNLYICVDVSVNLH